MVHLHRKGHCSHGPPVQGELCHHEGQQGSPCPLPSPLPCDLWSRSPPWLPHVTGQAPSVRPIPQRSKLNLCITLQNVGSNAVKAQPGAIVVYYVHPSPTPTVQPACLQLAGMSTKGASGSDKCQLSFNYSYVDTLCVPLE